ncbi:hypothetical protein [Hyphobacterium marinum]|uniref:Uncharacterized protein n=1 Tax=Hyphobacterium marinum TaxID=3116574 RepID=A0ABU7LUN5_9PROT|nr:hypothetical protein [Hyphobacterium sp. Y6023]MEE2565271.1 hypothetical protein [Hyphobacterium sp. Y6023]
MNLISLFAAAMLSTSAQEADTLTPPSAPALDAQSNSLRHTETEAGRDDNAEMPRQAEEERETGEAMRARPDADRDARSQPLRRRGVDNPGTNSLGGGDPGWEVRGEARDEFGGDEPSWARQPDGSDASLGGGDPGWEVQGDADRRAASHGQDAMIRDRGEYLCQCSGAGSCGSYVEDDALHCSPYDGNGGRICSGSCSMRTPDDGARSTPATAMPER